jgi:small-conductance mechanosensitive channel
VAGAVEFELGNLIAPAGFVLGGLLVGFASEKVLLSGLRERLSGTRLDWGGVLLRSFRWMVTLWFGVAGAYLALARLSPGQPAAGIARDLLLSVLILSGALVVARIAGGLVGAYTSRVENLPSSSLFATTARVIVMVVGVLVVLRSLGIAVSPIVAGLGLGGLAVSLALQNPLSNLLAGYQVIVSRQLAPGDFVSLGADQQGYVQDIKWRNTTIRNLDGDLGIVPNSSLIGEIIVNHHRPTKETRVLVPMRVAPGSNLSRVEEVTLEVAGEVMREVPGGVSSFEPLVRYDTDGIMGTDFSVIMRAREYTDRFLVVHEFVKRLDERYRREGIEVPYATTYGVHPNGSEPGGNS